MFDILKERVGSQDVDGVKGFFKENKLSADIGKLKLEEFLKTKCLSLISEGGDIEKLRSLLAFIIVLCRNDLCPKAITCAIMQDVFETSSTKRCLELFNLVENLIVTWKEPFFFDACKNQILRMCNDLLKRLSRTLDTEFCGRIFIFLAKTLPLEEKSGLNLTSQFNLANVTLYEEKKENVIKPTEEDVDMEVGEIRETKEEIDYELYKKFWGLQAYFVNPVQIFHKEPWKTFDSSLSSILDVFTSQKVDKINSNEHEKGSQDQAWFSAKYLTSNKLFLLQLNDSQFRRYFLTQCLVTFEFLTNNTKTKDRLNADQEKLVKEYTDKAYALLKETYPNGSHFAKSVKKVLQNDRQWAQWKSETCPNLLNDLKPNVLKLNGFKPRPLNLFVSGVVDLGNPELTRLWNVGADNISSCQSDERIFIPNLERVAEDALDELDPEQQVEDEYKSVNDEKYQWTCSRHLLWATPQYLAVNPPAAVNAIQKTSEYLSSALINICDEFPRLKERAKAISTQLKELDIKNKEAEEQKKKEEEMKKKEEEIIKEEEEKKAREAALIAKAKREEQRKKEIDELPVSGPATPPNLHKKPEVPLKRANSDVKGSPIEPKKPKSDKSSKKRDEKRSERSSSRSKR
ncbi:unnamed protein product [Bursaphelenchus xylophilus]|uniref:(pine wood nematode) hypothetical protein n=1 Tax=Bursaphelenchus xylophilus TaxID=6326 RepID=A0A1I7RPU5_BURXY|nr:unnamed protein product [Bursaphelenchus xylophilus]CAG9096637.1 unnamed protein product [Bursaphelenchus xylophilus]